MSGGFFQNIKGKITETVKNIAGPNDPYERRLYELVERATDEHLPSPDWAVNIELVDTVNSDPQGATATVLRALRRAFLKPNINTQLLALTALESCVKNCLPYFFQFLIQSELWHEIMRVGDPVRRWDAEVRDRALILIEDFGRGLPMEAYKEAYEGLLDRGVDFPARPPQEDHGVPYYTPPAGPPPGMGPEEGLSAEDAAAINAALAQNELEERQRQEQEAALAPPGLPPGGHVPAAMGPAVLMGAPIRPPGYRPPPTYHPPPPPVPPFMATPHPPDSTPGAAHPGAFPPDAHFPGGAPTAAAAGGAAGGLGGVATAGGASAGGVPPGVPLPANDEEAQQAVRVALNSAELLVEMLAPIQAAGAGADPSSVQELFITDLADQCYRYRSVLAEVIPQAGSEELVSAALSANDELQKALMQYETLSAQLLGGAGGDVPAAGVTTGVTTAPVTSSGGAVPPAATPAGSGAGGERSGRVSAGSGLATFTLLGDDEAEEEAQLQTSRGYGGVGVAGGVEAAPPAANASAGGAGDLIDFDFGQGAGQGAAAGGGTAGGAAEAAATGLEQISLKD